MNKLINQFGLPPTICIRLLNWCNLNCANCRSDSSPRKKGEIDFGALIHLLNDLKHFGNWRISLTGGEPTYYSDLDKVIKELNNLDYFYSLTTNGIVAENVINKIFTKFNTKGKLHVSIDGNRQYHDLQRGTGNYTKTLLFLKLMSESSIHISVTCVLYFDPNLWIDEFMHDLNMAGCKNITFISPVNDGRRAGDFNKDYISYYKIISEYIDLNYSCINHYFLDFNLVEDKYSPVTFIDAEGNVFFPQDKSEERVSSGSIFDHNIGRTIFTHVLSFKNKFKNTIV